MGGSKKYKLILAPPYDGGLKFRPISDSLPLQGRKNSYGAMWKGAGQVEWGKIVIHSPNENEKTQYKN